MAQSDQKRWNRFLSECLANLDINRLARTKRALQKGMSDVVNKKMSTPVIADFFIRLDRSIWNTIQKIIRQKIPMPGDNSKLAKQAGEEWLKKKRARDQEVQAFIKKVSY